MAGQLTSQLQIGTQSIVNSGPSNGFLAQLQINGQANWLLLNQSATSTVSAIDVDENGLTVGGQYKTTLQISSSATLSGPSTENVYVAKIDRTGQVTQLASIHTSSTNQLCDLVLINGYTFALDIQDSILLNGQLFTHQNSQYSCVSTTF